MDYPVTYSVDYPDRLLNRLTTFFRFFVAIPIVIVLGTVSGGTWVRGTGRETVVITAAGGLLFAGPLLLILFRRKYPQWWFEWNRELLRFSNRVAGTSLNRWLPLVKWLLAIPHYIVLFFLDIAVFFVVIVAWFAVLFTGRYPRGLFDFVEGVIRWHNRVIAYALILVTDTYPPFQLHA